MPKDMGGGNKTKSSAGSNSTNKRKTGSRKPRNFNPKTETAGRGGRKPSVVGRYSPAVGPPDGPTAP